jgi:serine/threonine protein kinase
MELRTLHQSAHESIVSFYDGFYADGCIYIALEFMDSGNLADVLKQVGKIPELILAKITIQVSFCPSSLILPSLLYLVCCLTVSSHLALAWH